MYIKIILFIELPKPECDSIMFHMLDLSLKFSQFFIIASFVKYTEGFDSVASQQILLLTNE